MKEPLYSVLHATLGRPEKAFAAMEMFRKRAQEPREVEYLFAVNNDDPTIGRLNELVTASYDPSSPFWGVRMVGGDFRGSAQAWNEAAKGCRGMILIQGQDDIEPPEGWDRTLGDRYARIAREAGGVMVPAFIAVSDGYRKDELCCTAIMTRSYAALEGHFICPEYMSVFSDDEVTYRSKRNARDGKSVFIDARDVVFRHQHHYHVKDSTGKALVDWDTTYAKENSAEAYAHGEKLFRARNPKAATDGLKTW